MYSGNHFLKVEDIKASGPVNERITKVADGQFDKLNLTFHDGTQLSLNKTNFEALARAYGMESDDWLGKEVELLVGEVLYQGKPQEAIRVSPISPPIKNKVPPDPEFDDEAPF
jgi:hypothetical protein